MASGHHAARHKGEANLRLELSHLDAASGLGEPVAILPARADELRRLDNYLGEANAGARRQRADENMDAGTEAKHEAIEVAVEHQIAAGEQDLARRRDSRSHGEGDRQALHGGHRFCRL